MAVDEEFIEASIDEFRLILDRLPSLHKGAGQSAQLYELLTLYDFLQAKMDIIGLEALIDDYALVKDFGENVERLTLQRIADALRASTVLLRQAPEELWNQVKGRADVALHTDHPRPVPRLDLRFATLFPADEALLQIFHGHNSMVTSCALSADGCLALSASNDKTLRVWDTITGKCRHTLKGPSDVVKDCALSADGQRALSISSWPPHSGPREKPIIEGRMLWVWNTTTGKPLHVFKMKRNLAPLCCSLSSDGQRALLGIRDGTLRLMDIASGRFLSTIRVRTSLREKMLSYEINGCTLRADGQRALSGTENGTVRVWDMASGQSLYTLKGHTHPVTCCALSANGNLALSGSEDWTLRLWNIASGQLLYTLKGHMGAVRGCALSADGQVALSASQDGTVRIWDTASGQLQRILEGHAGAVTCCALSADGRLALSGSEDGTVRVWQIASGPTPRTQESHADHAGWITSCALSMDGNLALSSSNDGTLRLWDTTSGQIRYTTLEGHRRAVLGCALSADGQRALSASADQTLRFWDTESGKTLRTLKRRTDKVPGLTRLIGTVKGLAALLGTLRGKADYPDDSGSWIGMLSVPFPSSLTLQSLSTLITFMGYRGFVLSCALSADGRLALSTSSDRKLRLWDTERGRILRTTKHRWATVNGCALSADGRLGLTATKDDRRLRFWYTSRRWRVAIRNHVIGRHWNTGHTHDLIGCALSADGYLALTASRDRTLRLWDVRRGRLLYVLKGHRGEVYGCALSSDGCFALSVADDHTLRLWDTTNGREVARWTHDITLWCCALNANGRLAVAGDIQGGVHFLSVEGLVKAEDAPTAKPPMSWLAEKPTRKPGMLRRLFGRHRRLNMGEKQEGESEVPLSEGTNVNMHITKQTLQGKAALTTKEPGEASEKWNRDRFEKFTEQARSILSYAQEEARRLQHNYIGTEHLLLGLIREDKSVAAKVLANLGVELNKIRSAVEFVIGPGDHVASDEISVTSRTQKVLELAVDEARRLSHHYIGPEHLLLGLVREEEGIAAGVLQSLGINLGKVRAQTIQVLNHRKIEGEASATMIEVTVESVRINEQTQQRVVILQAKEQKAAERERFLFIWIDQAAAYAIAIELQSTQPDPVALLPHGLLKNVIDALGAKIEGVEIWDLQEDVFRGRIVLDAADRRLQLNARPADAIALALRAGAPIFVAEQVMKQAGVLPDTPDESSSLEAQT